MKKILPVILICCVLTTLLCMNPGGKPVFAQDNFTFTKAPVDLTGYRAVTYANGVYFIAGEGGSLLSSKDAKTWTKLTSNTKEILQDIIWNGHIFVAVANGTIITSEDGTEWTVRLSGAAAYLNAVAWDGKQFVVVGTSYTSGGMILTSTDGLDWTNIAYPNGLDGVAWNGRVFAAVGAEGAVATSTDGVHWEPQVSKTLEGLNNIAWNGSLFTAVGSNGVMIYSKDGVTWSAALKICSDHLYGIAVRDNLFFVTGTNGTVLTSENGVDWKTQGVGTSQCLNGITWGNERFVVVGNLGRIYTSSDGDVWEDMSQGTAENLYSVSWMGSQFIIQGAENILTSPDGQLWKEIKTGISDGGLSAVTWNTQIYVGVGSRRVYVGENSFYSKGVIYTSKDGNIWIKRLDLDYNGGFSDVVYNGKTFVAVGYGGEVFTSENGLEWTMRRIDNNTALRKVLWEGNQFFALTYDSKVLVSLDGYEWEVRALPYDFVLNDICYNGNVYIAVGNKGLIATSGDGVTWEKQVSGLPWTKLNSVVWTGGQAVAVGEAGKILTSPDGINWAPMQSNTNRELYSVAWDGNKLLAVGEFGTIVQGVKTGPSYTPAPVIAKVTSPENGSSLQFHTRMGPYLPIYTVGIPIKVDIKDTGKTIDKVEFYRNDKLLGISKTSPYTYNWEYQLQFGSSESLKAKVIYTDGTFYETSSSDIRIQVSHTDVFAISSNISGYIKPDFLDEENVSSAGMQGFKVQIGDKSAFTDSNGYFSLSGVVFTYPSSGRSQTAKITKSNYLERNMSFTIAEQVKIGSQDSPVEMWAGDMSISSTQDGAINMADIMEIAKYFNSVSGDSRYNAEADLNQDSAVNMADIMIAAKHFNAVSQDYMLKV